MKKAKKKSRKSESGVSYERKSKAKLAAAACNKVIAAGN